jgi:hypothetical protein
LEDPDEGAEAGREGGTVHHDGLGRDQYAAGYREEQQERGRGDDRGGVGGAVQQRGHEVAVLGGEAADLDVEVGPVGADVVDHGHGVAAGGGGAPASPSTAPP